MISRRGFMGGAAAACLSGSRTLFASNGSGTNKVSLNSSAPTDVSAPSVTTRIGNFYFRAPNGISFIKDDAAAFVINPGGPYSAGTVSPNDSFHKVIFSSSFVQPHPHSFVRPGEAGPADMRRVEFQWSRMGEVVLGRLISAYPGDISFKINQNWPGFQSEFSVDGSGIKGIARIPNGETITWRLKSEPAVMSLDVSQFTLPLGGSEHPTYIVAGFGELPSFDGIDQHLAEAERLYEERRPRADGPSGDILAAITDNLNNSRIYSNDNHTVAISVSRTFGGNSPNSCPYFCWDSFFSALLANLGDPEMGRQTVRTMLSYQRTNGMVPNYAHTSHLIDSKDDGISEDRSDPPVGSMCVWKMHLRWPDVEFLREIYPKLAAWNAWWLRERNAKKDGLLQWGSSTGTLRGAQWETGWDDTPHFEGVHGVKMVGSVMNVYAVDLCSLWSMDAHYLSLIAAEIGMHQEAAAHHNDSVEMNQRINARLWNESLGIYCSRFWDHDDGTPGEFLTRLTPANFYPLICGAPNRLRADRVLSVMLDPEQFWGEWVLPTVSRKDPYFLRQTYWHGTIWAPVNYLVFQGVKRYASSEVQAAFAQKSVRLFMDNWLAEGSCAENYLSIDGGVGGDPNYTWGALLCLIGIESIVDISDAGVVKEGPGFREPMELFNLPIRGELRKISLRYGRPVLSMSV